MEPLVIQTEPGSDHSAAGRNRPRRNKPIVAAAADYFFTSQLKTAAGPTSAESAPSHTLTVVARVRVGRRVSPIR